VAQRTNNPSDEIEDVYKALDRASESGLEAEVILWALYHMRENPNASIADCLNDGLREWIK
jgi:hypothetical protein